MTDMTFMLLQSVSVAVLKELQCSLFTDDIE